MNELNKFQALQPKEEGEGFTGLEVFEFKGTGQTISFATKEFTAFCPVTNQPDFYELEIAYEPDQLCVESKSLKLWLQGFRNHRAFGEYLVERLLEEFSEVVKPRWVFIRLVQNIRGGLQMTVESSKYRGDE